MGGRYRLKRKLFTSVPPRPTRGTFNHPYPTDSKGKELPRERWNGLDLSKTDINIVVNNKTYPSDMKIAKTIGLESRIKKLKKSLLMWNVFDNDPKDPSEYTHRIGIDKYTYSKDITNTDRMTYRISKPEAYIDLDTGETRYRVNITIDHVLGHQAVFKGKTKRYSE